MKRNIYYFNSLLRTYNKYSRKLDNLRKTNKNERRQHILQNHIEKLYEKLIVLKMSVKLATATTVVATALAFAPQSATAQITFGAAQANLFGLSNIGYNSNPVFADLDNDGDLDMLAGTNDGNFFYFQNTGTTTAPVFAPVQINPFGLVDIGFLSDPTFADLDGDGDLDMLTGDTFGNFSYFENTGTPSAPVFAPFTVNPFGLTNTPSRSNPTFVDLDNDGDLDILSGTLSGGNFNYFENTGTPTTPVFASFTTNPFGLVNVTNRSTPTFADLDGDGDLDMLTGDNGLNIKYFENIGTLTAPSFAPFTTNPFGLGGTNFYFTPTFADLDNDGDLDLMAGENLGNFIYFENITPCTTDQTVTAAQTTFCASGGSTTINLDSSETGVNYFLRNNANDTIISGPVAGTGSGISLNTGNLTATTTFNVYGAKSSAIDLPDNIDIVRFNTPFSAYTNTITIEAWVDFKGTQLRAGQSTAGADNMATNVWLWDAGGWLVNDNGTWRGLPFPSTIPTGWTHVATVANASGMFIYYNGVLVASNTTGIISSIRNNPSSIIDLGHDPRFPANVRNTNHSFDNFRVWNTARSASEVSSSMDSCLIGTEVGLVQYTRFEEGTGTTLNSITGVNGTIFSPSATPWITGSSVCASCDLEMTQTATVTVLPALTGNNNTTICNEESIVINGTTYNAANPTGTEVFTNVGPNGCDSTVTVALNVLPALTGNNNTTICNEESIVINGTTYNAANPTGTEVFTNVGPNGCDSTVTVALNVLPALTGTNTTTICNEESIVINGTTYNAASPTGTEVFTNVGANGCDSTVTVALNVLPALTGTNTTTICNEESIVINGTTYNAANPTGTEVFTNVGANGCDSTVTVALNVLPALVGTDNTTICATGSVIINGTTYDAANPTGTEVFTNVGANGCDSTVTVALNVLAAVDVTIDNSLTPTLSANQAGATYRWLDCDNGNAVITSETGQTFTATANGNYAVEITVGSCVDTSACENITGVGISPIVEGLGVRIYPNPTNGMVNISLTSNNSAVDYTISSIEGKVIETGKTSTNNIAVDLSKEGNGVYFIKINTASTSTVYKLIKQ
jgi:uncharacterized protein YuzB (UPF0349 family)